MSRHSNLARASGNGCPLFIFAGENNSHIAEPARDENRLRSWSKAQQLVQLPVDPSDTLHSWTGDFCDIFFPTAELHRNPQPRKSSRSRTGPPKGSLRGDSEKEVEEVLISSPGMMNLLAGLICFSVFLRCFQGFSDSNTHTSLNHGRPRTSRRNTENGLNLFYRRFHLGLRGHIFHQVAESVEALTPFGPTEEIHHN